MDIDIVVLWVDGSDPDWLEEKRKYDPDRIDDSNSDNRFRDWGLMKYWFRGVEEFAPWVRTVHFVTWGHLPDFLNINHPKLNIVRHEDYMPKEWLPTFNANALEMNLHRIPGLSDHFVFFNDDMFILRPLKENDFFKKGLPCAQATELPFFFWGDTKVWQFLAANDLGIINKWFLKSVSRKGNRWKYFNLKYHWYDNIRSVSMGLLFPEYFAGFKNFHCPAAFCKSTFAEIWEKEPQRLVMTSCNKFRSREDVNQWLALWWQIAEGRFYPKRINNTVCAAREDEIQDVCNCIMEQQSDFICINDPPEHVDFESMSLQLKEAFRTILPNKSSFEK